MPAFSNPAAYEHWMGRWSSRLAPTFVSFVGPPSGARVLDVGAGTGVLSTALLEHTAVSTVVGIEPAEDYVAYCRATFSDPRLRFEKGDGLDIPFAADSFDATLSLLILQELPDVQLALDEMRRVTRPGGLVAASQWDFALGMPMLRLFWDTVVEVLDDDASRAAATDCMVVDYPDAAALRSLWRDAGLVEIATERHPVAMAFASFEDYWMPFLSNVTPTSSYASKLDSEAVAEIEKRLRGKALGPGPDRSFTLQAHAWSIRGTVPVR